jgi:hypothetical protein
MKPQAILPKTSPTASIEEIAMTGSWWTAELNENTPIGHAMLAQGHPWQLNPGAQNFLNEIPNMFKFISHVAITAVWKRIRVKKFIF